MFDKMKQLYEMQKRAREIQRQLESIHVEKAANNGMLRVRVNGTHKVEEISIDSSYLAPEKKNALERALCDLLNDSFSDIQKQTAAQAASLMKGIPGL
jgi:DNA-binding YbaB/EbfC family protein